jgi:hypothetical protein
MKTIGTIFFVAIIATMMAAANIYIGKAYAQADTSTDNSGGSSDNSGGGGGGSTDNSGGSPNNAPATDNSQQSQQPTTASNPVGDAVGSFLVHKGLQVGCTALIHVPSRCMALPAQVVGSHHHHKG